MVRVWPEGTPIVMGPGASSVDFAYGYGIRCNLVWGAFLRVKGREIFDEQVVQVPLEG